MNARLVLAPVPGAATVVDRRYVTPSIPPHPQTAAPATTSKFGFCTRLGPIGGGAGGHIGGGGGATATLTFSNQACARISDPEECYLVPGNILHRDLQ